ncbi:glycerate kinase type-2 family protein [Salidesulfovibrio brasiliensis]
MPQSDKGKLTAILDAALAAVAPDGAVERNTRLDGTVLHAAGAEYDLSKYRRVLLLGAGKGAAPMAAAVESLLGERLDAGLAVVKYGHGQKLSRTELREADHPVPDAAGEVAANELLTMAESATEDDLVIVVLTGGASALTPANAEGIALADVQETTRLMLESGANIHEINAVRKHLSAFGGGLLAKACHPATVLAFIVSDVVGDDLDVIASGPVTPDPSTFGDCVSILHRYDIFEALPEPVAERLQNGMDGAFPETPKEGDPVFENVRTALVATNRMALDAAAEKAAELGFEPTVLTDKLTGEARKVAVDLVREACSARHRAREIGCPVCLLAGGETTVTITGDGRGGRNQEMALAATLELGDEQGVCALFAGTDGTDGPTDAAGGFALPNGLARAMECAVDPRTCLLDNDSYTFLEKIGCLLVTGPTRTNVMDIAVLLVHP